MTASALALLGGAASPLVEDAGSGRAILLLHGGAGPASMRPLLPYLAGYRCVLPTHPGFDRTRRPSWLSTISDLAVCYLALIDRLALSDVLVVGNSVGGWIAAEMAIRQPAALRGIVLINAVGIAPDERTGPIVDPRSLAPETLASYAFADPSKAQPATPEAAEQIRENQSELNAYAGEPFMNDPQLSERLGMIDVPAMVLWGESDRIVTPAYGKAFAEAIPGAVFERIADAGHMPQVEQPRAVAGYLERIGHRRA